MSEIQTDQPSQPVTSGNTHCSCRSHWRWTLPIALILGLCAAGFLAHIHAQNGATASPFLHEATAYILVRSTQPSLLFDAAPAGNYDAFVNTQLVLLRLPEVLDRALEDPTAASLPILAQQKNKGAYLANQLRVQRVDGSEVVSISIKTNSVEASAKIVNAVVDAYMVYIDEVEKMRVQQMLSNLNIERRRHQGAVATLRNAVREAIGKEEQDDKTLDSLEFDQRQLARVEKLTDQIEDRIMALLAEQRAPDRITVLSLAR